MLSFLIGLVLTPNTITLHNPPPEAFHRVEERHEPTLREVVLAMAEEQGVDVELVDNIITCESNWNPDAFNKTTGDVGLWQINSKYWPDVDAENPLRATKWAVQRIKDGYAHEWVCANCYLYIKAYYYPDLPAQADLTPNTYAYEGAIALFEYPNGVKHLAYIDRFDTEGFWVKEANYTPGKIDERLVDYNDSALIGFWGPLE